jgi:hypothetical protein
MVISFVLILYFSTTSSFYLPIFYAETAAVTNSSSAVWVEVCVVIEPSLQLSHHRL